MDEDSGTTVPKHSMDATPETLPLQYDAALTKGMEHMRPYVSVSSRPSLSPTTITTTEPITVYGIPSTAMTPLRHPQPHPNPPKRTDPFQFGSRLLTTDDDIFSHNAWDHVEVDAAYKDFADLQYQLQRDSPVSDFDKQRFNGAGAPEKWWNKFYANNAANFFKDRKWLFQEFPALKRATEEGGPAVTVLEVGAGAGNTAFPILAANRNSGLMVHACDFSKTAVDLIRANPLYDSAHIQADVWDVAAATTSGDPCLPPGLGPGSVDIVILIFIFSALAPSQWSQALRNIFAVLKPGGEILFRDYGRGDLAQVRFKKGRWLGENFYIRGDGTRVYFFEKEQLGVLFGGDGYAQEKEKEEEQRENLDRDEEGEGVEEEKAVEDLEESNGGEVGERPRFDVLNLGVDRRMLVNRQRKLKMYRCWMQGRFAKPAEAPTKQLNATPNE